MFILMQNLMLKFSDVVDVDQIDTPTVLPGATAIVVEKAKGKRGRS